MANLDYLHQTIATTEDTTVSDAEMLDMILDPVKWSESVLRDPENPRNGLKLARKHPL